MRPAYAALDCSPVTDEARAFIAAVVKMVECQETRERQRGPEMAQRYGRVIGFFVADLLRTAGSATANGWVYRSLRPESFTGDPMVSARHFNKVVVGLQALGLIEFLRGGLTGFVEYVDDDDSDFDIHAQEASGAEQERRASRRKASHYKATAALLALAEEHNIRTEDVGRHFVQALPPHPVVLRTSSEVISRRKVRGVRVNVQRDKTYEHLREAVAAQEATMHRLNTFLDGFMLKGGTHRGYIRVYNRADREGFNLDHGGRLYGRGDDNYQQLGKEDRRKLTIGGKDTLELDVKASYLTILHARMGLDFDPSDDPYEVPSLPILPDYGPGLRRAVVKQWCVATLGHSKHHTRWPSEMAKGFREETGRDLGRCYPFASVKAAMTAKFPVFADWGTLGVSWSDLMYVESEAIITTMLRLMDEHEMPSLSVHDSLIIREGDVKVARQVLRDTYGDLCGIAPMIEQG